MRRKKSTADEIARRVRHGEPAQPAPLYRFSIHVVPSNSLGPVDPKKVEKSVLIERGQIVGPIIPVAEIAEPDSPRRRRLKILAWLCFAILSVLFLRWLTS